MIAGFFLFQKNFSGKGNETKGSGINLKIFVHIKIIRIMKSISEVPCPGGGLIRLSYMLTAILLFTAVGCKKLVREIRLTREQMVFALDDAITSIQNSPATWQTTMSDLEEEFQQDINTNMGERISVLKNELIGQTATGIICLIDCAANRAVYNLAKLKAELLGEELPLPTPYLCSTSHYTVDLNTDVSIRREVIFYGYDFIQREKVTAYFVNNNGTETYMDNAVHFLTNYQFVVDLAPYNDNFLKQYNYVSIRFDGEEISNIAIQKDNIPPPTRTESITPGTFGFIPPFAGGGDTRIGDNGASVSLWTKLGRSHRQAYLTVRMSVLEQGGNFTKANGWSDKHIFYTAPDGWHIKRIDAPLDYSILLGWRGNDNEKNLQLDLGLWTLYGYNGGSDVGSDTRVSVNFNTPFTIIIEKDN